MIIKKIFNHFAEFFHYSLSDGLSLHLRHLLLQLLLLSDIVVTLFLHFGVELINQRNSSRNLQINHVFMGYSVQGFYYTSKTILVCHHQYIFALPYLGNYLAMPIGNHTLNCLF